MSGIIVGLDSSEHSRGASVSSKVMHHAGCPVVVVPGDQPAL
jgi:nucleotide-binding universal stress UspA family protein